MTNLIDTTHDSLKNLPAGFTFPKVGGYGTGSDGVKWLGADWARFPNSGHLRIDQEGRPDLMLPEADCETGTMTPKVAVQVITARLEHGHARGGVYADRDNANRVGELAHNARLPLAQIDLRLADWNLSEDQARAVLGTKIAGLTVRAVQWASPTSNPHTILPGTPLTLAQANVDLNVSQAWYHAPPAPHWITAAAQLAANIAHDSAVLSSALHRHE